jgi:hypothetical protein
MMSEKSFFDRFKKKAGEVLGHPYVQQASSLGQEVLNITASLAHNRNPLSIGSAVIAGANVIAEALNIEFTNPINFYVEKHDLKVQSGELHKLLIKSGAEGEFSVGTVLKLDNMSMIRMTIAKDSEMYWIHRASQLDRFDIFASADEVVSQYWLSPEFNHSLVHDFFWKKYPTGINLSYGKNSGDSNIEVDISALPGSNQYTDMAMHPVGDMISYIRLSKSLAISRSFLLCGKPGTGKTSWCERIAQDFGSRLVKVDASFLESIENKEIEQILSVLKPEIVLFDDFDRVDFDEYEGKFLYITENLKRKYPTVSFFATVNNTEELGEALLRPGRFDEKFEFTLPSAESCIEIMQAYSTSLGVTFDSREVEAAMAGRRFTPAECKEVILRMKLRPGSDVKAIFDDLRAFHAGDESSDADSDLAEAALSAPTARDFLADSVTTPHRPRRTKQTKPAASKNKAKRT